MANKRKRKAVASTVDNAKDKAEAESRGGALRRAAKVREKASARAKKVQGNVHKWSSQLHAALMALEKTDVGSAKAREVEESARAALKKLLVRRKKLRKARKALRRAEAKERKAHDRAGTVTVKKARARAPAAPSRKVSKTRPARKRQAKKTRVAASAAQTRKAPKTRPAQKRQAEAGPESSAPKPSELNTMPAIEAVSGVDAGVVERVPDDEMT